MSLPTLFIGSSSEQKTIVEKLIGALAGKAACRPWYDVFMPGETTIQSLIGEANKADFALFVFGADDWTHSRDAGIASPRDNVVFEAGLFGGILGMQRSLIVYDRNVKLPSDLLGLTQITYDGIDDLDGKIREAGHRVAEVIERKGWRGSEGLPGQIAGTWWQYTLSDAHGIEPSVLAFIEIESHGQRPPSLQGRAWTRGGELISQFRSRAMAVSEEAHSLFYYWEGEWPGQSDVQQMFGKGEVQLDDPQHASGHFTVRSDGPLDPHERRQVRYYRARPGDAEILDSGGKAAKALIRKQLEKRAGTIFSST